MLLELGKVIVTLSSVPKAPSHHLLIGKFIQKLSVDSGPIFPHILSIVKISDTPNQVQDKPIYLLSRVSLLENYNQLNSSKCKSFWKINEVRNTS